MWASPSPNAVISKCVYCLKASASQVIPGYYVLGKSHMRSTPLSDVAFKTAPVFVWMRMTLSRPLKEDRRKLPLFTPLSSRRSMLWYILGFVRAESLKLLNTSFRDANHLCSFLCPPVCLLGRFTSLRHVQGSTYRLPIPLVTSSSSSSFYFFYFYFLASSLNLWRCWHSDTDCRTPPEVIQWNARVTASTCIAELVVGTV